MGDHGEISLDPESVESHVDLHVVLQVEIEILNDDQWEPDEEFFLKISLLNLDEYPHSHDNLALGKLSIMEITILNDDGQF
jgi:solute carrier family 8 (sodium/calcium exchanger)